MSTLKRKTRNGYLKFLLQKLQYNMLQLHTKYLQFIINEEYLNQDISF